MPKKAQKKREREKTYKKKQKKNKKKTSRSAYTLCLKKHPRHFYLLLEKALSDFHNIWHTCYRESKQSVDASALPEKGEKVQ